MNTDTRTFTGHKRSHRWWTKPTAFIGAFVLSIGGVFLGQSIMGITPAQAAPTESGLTNEGFDPHWTVAPEIKANWLQPLYTDSVYWTSDWSTGQPINVGDTVTMLGQSYDFAADSSSYKTRPAMEFERTATGPATFNNLMQFSTQAIAPIGGSANDPDAPLTVYFWSHDGTDAVNTSVLNCSTIATGLNAINTITVARVTSGDDKVYVGCMPAPDGGDTLPPNPTVPRAGFATGGEGDQMTGLIYTQTNFGAFDSLTGATAGLNTSAALVTFGVWDPETGNYSQSGPVQPADLNMTSPATSVSRERMLATADMNSDACPYGTDGRGAGCVYPANSAAADFGLDALGNIYIYTGQDSPAGTNGNMALLRVVPTRDSQGNIISATASEPWRYNVVTKLTKATSTMYVSAGEVMVGTGIHNGRFLGGGYVNAYDTASQTYPANASNTIPASNTTAARMVNIDPLSGQVTLTGSTENAKAIDTAHPAGYSMGQDIPGGYRDDASAQMLTVIGGTIYNDADGDGAISTSEVGVPGVTIAVYRDGTLIGSQLTSEDGSYQLVMPGNGTYDVRVVQPQIDGINAAQSYAGTTSTLNTLTFHCVNGDITAGSGQCDGALDKPYVAPALGAVASESDPTTWPLRATAEISSNTEVATADFGITTMGSYGDSAFGPATVADGAPLHVNGPDPTIWLGDTAGVYAGPADDNSHATDDGVHIDSYAGSIPLEGTVLAATRSYDLAAALSGADAADATVTGWTNDGSSWNTQAAWSPTTSGTTDVTAQGSFQLSTTPVGSASAMQLRVNASSSAATAPTNTDNEYQAPTTDSTKAWVTAGEIEDYSLTAADAVVRTAVTNPGAEATFTVTNGSASETLTAGGETVTAFGAAAAVADGATQEVTVTAPSTDLTVASATAKDTESGEVVPATVTTEGTVTTISVQAHLGDDILVQVTYGDVPDTTKSTLTLDKDTASIDESITATATVVDQDNKPLAGVEVTFGQKNPAVTTVDITSGDPTTTCTTNASGVCSVRITSATPGVYTDQVSATVLVSGADAALSGSPKSVTFTGSVDAGQSSFTVAPVADPVPADPTQIGDTNWPVANGAASYTGVFTARDSGKNLLTTLNVADMDFGTSSAKVSVSSVTNNHDGTYTVEYTSTTADPAYTTTMTYQDSPIGATAPIPFKYGEPKPGPFTCADGRQGTHLEVVTPVLLPATSTATALVTDEQCNPIPGVPVTFTLTQAGSATLDPTTPVTTDNNGLATAIISDTVAETVTIKADMPTGKVDDPTTVTFTTTIPEGVDPSQSSFAVTPVADPADTTMTNWQIVTTGSYTGTLTAVGYDGQPLTTLDADELATLDFQVSSTDVTVSAVTNNHDGTYSVTYTSTSADATATTTLTKNDTQIGQTAPIPFRSAPVVDEPLGPLDPAHSSFDVTPVADPVPTDPALISDTNWPIANGTAAYTGTLTAHDAADHPLPDLTLTDMTFTTANDDGKVVVSTVTNNHDGTYTVTYTTTTATTTATTTVDYTGTQIGTDTPIPFKYGEPKPGPFTCADGRQGTHLEVITPVVIPATSTATALVTDEQCNPIPGVDVTFALTQAGSATLDPTTPVTTDNSGLATVTISDTVAETVTIKADMPTGKVDDPKTITFTSPEPPLGPLDPAHSSFDVTPVADPVPTDPALIGGTNWPIANGTAAYTGTLTAHDAADHPLPDLTLTDMTFTTANDDGKVVVSTVTNNHDGTYTVTYTTTTATTTATTTVDYTGTQIGTDTPIPFKYGEPKPGPFTCADGRQGTHLEVITPVVIPATSTATALVTDEQCNPIPGVDVTFALTQAGSATLDPTTPVTTDNSGLATVTISDTIAEDVTIKADMPTGKVDDPKTITFNITPPIVPDIPSAPVITSPRNGDVTNANPLPVAGAGEAGASVIVTDTTTDESGATVTTPVCTTTVKTDGTWTCDVTVPDGDHSLTATQTNTDDVTSLASEPVNVTTDTTAPSTPTITTANGDEVVGSVATPVDSGTTVSVKDEDGATICDATVETNGTWSCLVPDGTVSGPITATATDPAGNTSEPANGMIDTEAPDAPVIDHANDSVIDGSAEPGSTVTITYPKTDGTTGTITTPVDPDGNWSIPTPSDAKDGGTISAVATDPAGNTSTPSEKTLDLTAPDAPVINHANDSVIDGSAEPGSTVTVTYPKDDGTTGTVTAPVDPDGNWSITTPSDAKDSGTVTAVATDPAGNTSTPGQKTIDRVAPDAPVIDHANGTVIDGSAEPGATITVTYLKDDGTTGTITTPVDPDGNWSIPTPSDAKDGGTISAVATDPAGNTSTPGQKTIDRVAPDAPVIDHANGTVIDGSAEPGATITVTYPKDDGTTGTITTPVDPDGNWSIPTPSDAKDGGTISAVATDPAGNTSTPSEKTLDLTAPAAPVVNPSNGSEFTGSGEPGGTVTVTGPDNKPVPGCEAVTINANGLFTCTPTTPLAPGDEVSVTVTDPAGNVSGPTVITVGMLGITVAYPTRLPGQSQIVTGTGFNPGEKVCLSVKAANPYNGGCSTAAADGKVSFTFDVPTDFGVGNHEVTLLGAESGSVSTLFEVAAAAPLVITGGTTSQAPFPYGLLIGGGVMVAAGLALSVKLRRHPAR